MKFLKRLLLSLLIALPLLGVMLIVSQTGALADTPQTTPEARDCGTCHKEFQSAWEGGRHAQASTNEAFVQGWALQGKPSACMTCHAPGYDAESGSGTDTGVTCQACHGPLQADHPAANMQVDTTGQLCAKCHSQPMAGEAQAAGAHDRVGMACTSCHNPHTNAFQAPPGTQGEALQNPSALCQNCHKDVAAAAEHSTHAAANVACVDCHMGVKVSDVSNPHAAPDHSASASVEACEACHSTQMHASAAALPPTQTAGTAGPGTLGAGFVAASPSPASPLGYTLISLLIGLACGFALAPLIERSSKRRKGGE